MSWLSKNPVISVKFRGELRGDVIFSLSKTVKTQGCQQKLFFILFFFVQLINKSDTEIFDKKIIMEDSQSDSENLNVNQRLDFSDLSSDEMEEDTKSDGATKSADNSGEIFFIHKSFE